MVLRIEPSGRVHVQDPKLSLYHKINESQNHGDCKNTQESKLLHIQWNGYVPMETYASLCLIQFGTLLKYFHMCGGKMTEDQRLEWTEPYLGYQGLNHPS